MPVPTQLEGYAQLLEQGISYLRDLEKLCIGVRDNANESLDTILQGIATLEAQQQRVQAGKFPEMGTLAGALIGGGAGLSLLGQQLLQMQGVSVPIPQLPPALPQPVLTLANQPAPVPTNNAVQTLPRMTLQGLGKGPKMLYRAFLVPQLPLTMWEVLEDPKIYGGEMDRPSIVRFFGPRVRDFVTPRVDWYSRHSQIRRLLRRAIVRIQVSYLYPHAVENATAEYIKLVNRLHSKYTHWEDFWIRLVELELISEAEDGLISEADPNEVMSDQTQGLILLGDTNMILRTALLGSETRQILHILPKIYGDQWQERHIWVYKPGSGSAGHRKLGEDVRLAERSALWSHLADGAEKIHRLYDNPSVLKTCTPQLHSLIVDLKTKYKSWDELSFLLKELGIID